MRCLNNILYQLIKIQKLINKVIMRKKHIRKHSIKDILFDIQSLAN